MDKNKIKTEGLTVVVPTYNGSKWLPGTISKIRSSIDYAKIMKFEIIVVDDGSTDDTAEIVKTLVSEGVRLVSQVNGGRFVARRTGAKAAIYPNLLFVDTRVYIGETSIDYLIRQHSHDESRNVWCSHVVVETAGNIYARFWHALTFFAWRKYFKDPRDISYGIKEFDDYPKGTTCFFIKKSILDEANKWFVANTKDIKTSNDDTLLLRHVAEQNSINISPEFWCLYHARSSMKQYVKHVYHRGKVFVDGFLRHDGNKYFWPLIGFLILTATLPLVLLVFPKLISSLLVAGVILWLIEFIALIIVGVPLMDSLSLFILSPIFAIYYGAGIWTAFFKIYVLNKLRNKNHH